jgi:trehalose synthase
MDKNPAATASGQGLPKAKMLYGSLAEQIEQPGSFAMQLKQLLAVRQAYGLAGSRQVAVPNVTAPALLIMVHELPDGRGTQITALNFGAEPIEEVVPLPGISAGPVVEMIREVVMGDVSEDGAITIKLEPYEGQSLRIVTPIRPVAL